MVHRRPDARGKAGAVFRGPLAALRTRLLDPGPTTRAEPEPSRTKPDVVVDYALYVDGQRQPGRLNYADANDAARRRRGSFVWLGCTNPTRR